ncbi:MAG: CDP-glycerol glycerophosphotransferase family protein [Oscillospiraceae bacterium]|nr:CDP-glycerol glycerophosphotransferase family protein [Oscillospiraceae bacterium]
MSVLCAVRQKLKAAAKAFGYKGLLPFLYRLYARQPADPNLVVFADNRDRPLPDNFEPLLKLCEERGKTCVVLTGKDFRGIPALIRFIRLYARCGVLFLTDFIAVTDVVPLRPETQVVQLWHACGLGKKWGYAVTSDTWGPGRRIREKYPMYVNQTLVSVSSDDPVLLESYRSAFGCAPETVRALGVPRTDVFFDEAFRKAAAEKARALFPEAAGRKLVLFAPTFRGESIEESYYRLPLRLDAMKEALGEEYALLLRLHPLTRRRAGVSAGDGFVFDTDGKLSMQEALCAADVLITDYSSILFEYLLLNRPIISFIPDLEQYTADRGLFLPYEEMAPGPYVRTQEELVEKLRTVSSWFDPDKQQSYRTRFMSACDGSSTERIYREVFKEQS